MAISHDFLDELKHRVDLPELIGRKTKLVKKGREYSGLCPFHKEKTPSFTVSPDKGFYHCFGCGAHGSAIDFVINSEGLSFPEAIEKLAASVGLQVPQQSRADQEAQARRSSLTEIMEQSSQWFEDQLLSAGGRNARDYLASRGVSDAMIRKFRLGYAPNRRDGIKSALTSRNAREEDLVESGMLIRPEDGGATYDRFRERLMFPIRDRSGRIVAFGGRALGDARAKYLNSPDTPLFHKGRMLYNLDQARLAAREGTQVIAVEGYMDVIALVEAGFPGAVAPLGTALTEQQIAEMWRLSPEPILCFDGDNAGQRAARRAAERALPLLKPGHSFKIALLPGGEDPDSLIKARGRSAMQDVLEKSMNLADFLWYSETSQGGFDTPERRAGLRQRLQSLANEIGDSGVKEFYQADFRERVSRAFGGGSGGKPAWQRNNRAGFSSKNNQRRFKGGNAQSWDRRLPASHSLGSGPQGAANARERVLISALLVHKDLIENVFDEVVDLHLMSPHLDNIRAEILKHGGLGEPLDLNALKNDISNSALRSLVEDLSTSEAGFMEPITQPNTPIDDVIRQWRHAYKLHRLDELREELSVAERRLGEDSSEEGFTRFLALQDAVRQAEAEAIEVSDD